MVGRALPCSVLSLWLVMGPLNGCGGQVSTEPRATGSGGDAAAAGSGGGSGESGGAGTGGSSGKPGSDAGRDAGRDAARDAARDALVPPECPDVAAPPPFDSQCDPFQQTGCSLGEACRPYVIYPTGPCEFERYGTTCAVAGRQLQGDPCGTETERCAAGFACLKTGQGLECARLCDASGASSCPAGLVCLPLDIGGIGACF